MATRINNAGWRRKRAKLQKNRLNARIDATRDLGALVAGTVAQKAPVDTARFKRSYVEAFNDLSDTDQQLPALRESKQLSYIVNRIARQKRIAESQVERWERNVASYRRRRQLSTDSGREAAKYLRQWKKQLAQAERELEKIEDAPGIETVILIGGRTRKRAGKFGPQSSAARVVLDVFGGSGRLLERGGVLLAEIRSREPHTRFVNRRTGVVSFAIAYAKSRTGYRLANRRYIKALTAGVPGGTR